MKRSQTSFALLSLAVVVPLLVLAGLAAIGIHSQWKHAEVTQNVAARATSDFAETVIATRMDQHFRNVPRYDDPPLPGPAAETSGIPDGDPGQLRSIRDNESETRFSESGLPLRAIVAMRIFELTGETTDAEAAIRITTKEAPSALTRLALEKINQRIPGIATDAIRLWQQDDQARRILEADTNLDTRGEWRDGFYFARSGNRFTYFQLDDLREAIGHFESAFGEGSVGYRLRVSLNGEIIHGPQDKKTGAIVGNLETSVSWSDPTLFTTMLPYGSGLQLDVVEVALGAYRSLVRKQIIITTSLFAIAIIGVMAGLWIIHRALARERKLNALKSDFVASVSHELRAPIASIRLMADALEDGKIQTNTAGEFHRLISREGARLSTLIENVLDFARIEQGRKEWHREESDLRKLILDTVSLMEPLASEKGISLLTDLPDEATAAIDSDAIRQALVNLIDNAVKFSPKDSSVKVTLSGNEIRITDEGPGIPQTEHRRIFEKFHRLGGELRRETQGTGIGLSLVKAIAEAHGGSVTVESEPGKGSTFILTLPNA